MLEYKIIRLKPFGKNELLNTFPIARAISASTGKITLAIATLLVNSVSVWQTTQIKNNKTKNGKS